MLERPIILFPEPVIASRDTKGPVNIRINKSTFGRQYNRLQPAFSVLKDAFEKANTTDIAAVRDAFNATNGSYVTGNLTFDEKRNPIKSAVMMEIVKKDGKLTPVYKATVNP